MSLKPLRDRVLLERIEQQEKTAGGIIIPDTAQEKPMEAKVLAAGPGSRNDKGNIVPLDVKAGDRVLIGKWAGSEVTVDGKELLIVGESDIMGVL
jgi:chaperonin GroES